MFTVMDAQTESHREERLEVEVIHTSIDEAAAQSTGATAVDLTDDSAREVAKTKLRIKY